MLRFLRSLQTATSDKPPAAEAKLLINTSRIQTYIDELSAPAVKLKPSALKNELNAALSFIKLTVTDPSFNASSETLGTSSPPSRTEQSFPPPVCKSWIRH